MCFRRLHAYSLRCTPPASHAGILADFAREVHACFEAFTGLHLDESQWGQAARGLAFGAFCEIAQLPTWLPLVAAQQRVDPRYNAVTDSHATSALALFKAALWSDEGLTLDAALAAKQKQLTQQLDGSPWRNQLASSTIAGRASLLSENDAGARAFLTAVPRGVTQCGAGSVCCRGQSTGSGWPSGHPADIFLPTFTGPPAALDFAIVAPHRAASLAEASQAALSAATSYAAVKKGHLNAESLCRQQGIAFQPFVLESTGAVEPLAVKVLRRVAAAAAARLGENPAHLHSLCLQKLSVLTRAPRASAGLRRRAASRLE